MGDSLTASKTHRLPCWLKIGLVVIGFMLLMPSVDALTYLEHQYDDIQLFDGCSYYNLANFDEVSLDQNTLRMQSKFENIGKIRNGVWEWREIENYLVKVMDKSISYDTQECELSNETFQIECNSVTKNNLTFKNESRVRYIWKSFDDFGGKIIRKKNQVVRYCYNIEREDTNNGFEVSVDIVPLYNNVIYSHLNWLNDTFPFKQVIEISVPQGIIANESVLKVVINSSNNGTNYNWSNECVTSNKTRSRISNGSENIEIDFWVQNCSVTAQDMILFLLTDQNVSDVTQNYYLYYGNIDILPTNGEPHKVWQRFDGFESASLNVSLWSEAQSGGTISISNSIITLSTAGAVWEVIEFQPAFEMSPPRTYYIYGFLDNDGVDNMISGVDDGFGSNVDMAMELWTGGKTVWTTRSGGGVSSVDRSLYMNVSFHELKIIINSSQVRFFIDDVLDATKTNDVPGGAMGPSIQINGAGRSFKADWVGVAPFRSREFVVTLGPEQALAGGNTSMQAVSFPVNSFNFASSVFVPAFSLDFNTTTDQNLSLLCSMNLQKLSVGGSDNIVGIRISVDGSVLLEEDLRTMTSVDEFGSVGSRPLLFNVTTGEHNVTVEFKRTGQGTINVSNIDVVLFSLLSNDDLLIRAQLTDAVYNHSSTVFVPAFNWTIPKSAESSTYYVIKQNLQKNQSTNAIASYFFEDLTEPHISPFWARLMVSTEIGSVSGNFFDVPESGDLNYTIQSRQEQLGALVFVNGSILDIDMIDSDENLIAGFQESDNLTNITSNRTFSAGTHLLLNSTVIPRNGNGFYVSMTSTFTSQSGAQDVTYMINSTNLTNANCSSVKIRTLEDNDDIGNVFIYTICSNMTVGESYDLNFWLMVSPGETITQLDESFNGFEVQSFDITLGQLAPIPNAITNPINGTNVSGSDTITWLEFDDPNGDLVTYNITLRNLDGTHNSTIGTTTNLQISVSWNSFPEDLLILMVEGSDPSGLSSNSTIFINIVPLPAVPLQPTRSFCEDGVILNNVAAERTITDGVVSDEIITERTLCNYGCFNVTLSNWGNPGCIESDFTLSLILIGIVLVVVFSIRRIV